MRGVEIYDGIATTGRLNFDLGEILAALGASTRSSAWRFNGLNYVSRDEQDVALFHQASAAAASFTTAQLREASDSILQVIDGEFTATRPGEEAPWLRVRAIDSSLWTVHSTDPNALNSIRARFADVRDAAEVPQN